jgi:hypothetical protein
MSVHLPILPQVLLLLVATVAEVVLSLLELRQQLVLQWLEVLVVGLYRHLFLVHVLVALLMAEKRSSGVVELLVERSRVRTSVITFLGKIPFWQIAVFVGCYVLLQLDEVFEHLGLCFPWVGYRAFGLVQHELVVLRLVRRHLVIWLYRLGGVPLVLSLHGTEGEDVLADCVVWQDMRSSLVAQLSIIT